MKSKGLFKKTLLEPSSQQNKGNQLPPIYLWRLEKKEMNIISQDIWPMGILNGEHLKRVRTHLLCTGDRMRIFLLHGMVMKMFQHGIIKPSMCMENRVF